MDRNHAKTVEIRTGPPEDREALARRTGEVYLGYVMRRLREEGLPPEGQLTALDELLRSLRNR